MGNLILKTCPRLRARLTENACLTNCKRARRVYEEYFADEWLVLDYNFDPSDIAIMMSCGNCGHNLNHRVPVAEVLWKASAYIRANIRLLGEDIDMHQSNLAKLPMEHYNICATEDKESGYDVDVMDFSGLTDFDNEKSSFHDLTNQLNIIREENDE